MSVILGVAGASRNAALALCRDGRVLGVCEHERITRTRRAPLRQGHLPKETLETVLALGGCDESDIATYAVAEDSIALPAERHIELLDHHYGHAATAFFSSPFSEATVIVCDRRGTPELTVWRADRSGIRREEFQWNGPGLATLYS